MQELHQKAKELLESGKVQVIIGYGNGSGDRVRPIFVSKSENVNNLIWDDRCKQNLAVYLNKLEIKKFGIPAIVATPVVVKTIIQLISENQLKSNDVVVLAVDNGVVFELTNNATLETYSAGHPVTFPPIIAEEIKKIAEMSIQQRYNYWQDELSRCFKCYACRAACPLCYCERCITDNNQPQWVCAASHAQGNFEWHINRAMHLAGRCVECGSCSIACPVGIPIGLLTIEASRIVKQDFGYEPGLHCNADSAMSSFKVEDTETFIK
jgi:ferredoxin